LPSAMVGISPSWVEPDGPLEPEPQELNPDCGHKSSIARCVSISPQRYSSSFGSQVPRFGGSAYYGGNDARQLAVKARGTQRTYNAYLQQPRLGVKDPSRGSPQFTSVVQRFNNGLGSHPRGAMALPSFAPGSGLDADRGHWSRNGFFHPRGPRLPQTAPSITHHLEASDLEMAAEHVDQMRLTMEQATAHSPRRNANMSTRTSRFIAPLNFTFGDPRQPISLHPPYTTVLGPGSFDATISAMDVKEPQKPHSTFGSGSPRLRVDPPPMNVGSNTSSLELDSKAWQQHVYMAKGKSGRVVPGPQPGSYEDKDGLGRAVSPERRSPDIAYQSDVSIQKRPLALNVRTSPQKYSPAFRSHAARLAPSYSETRSLEYPQAATDQFDLAASASSNFGPMAMASMTMDGGAPVSPSQPFASTRERFPPVHEPEGSEVDLLERSRKSWASPGQPITAHSNRFAHAKTVEGDFSPGPGTYIKPKAWKPASEHAAATEEHSSARRRLDLAVA